MNKFMGSIKVAKKLIFVTKVGKQLFQFWIVALAATNWGCMS
jgi:hypothetical protein